MLNNIEKQEIQDNIMNLLALDSTAESEDLLSIFELEDGEENNDQITVDNDDSNIVITTGDNDDFVLGSAKTESINGPLIYRGNYVNIRQLVFTEKEVPIETGICFIPVMNVQAIRLNDNLDMRLGNVNVDDNNIIDINVGESMTPTKVTNFSSDKMSLAGLSRKILIGLLKFVKIFIYTDFCVYKNGKGGYCGKAHTPTLWVVDECGGGLVRLNPSPDEAFIWEKGHIIGLKTEFSVGIDIIENVNKSLIQSHKQINGDHIFKYIYDAASTSQQRQGKLALKRFNGEKPYINRIKNLNLLTNGFIEIMATEYNGEPIDLQKIVKEVSSRVSLPITDSTSGAIVESIAIFPDKLYSIVNGVKVASADGAFFMSKDFAQRNLSANGFTVDNVLGSYFQSRDGVIKGLGLVVNSIVALIHAINYINGMDVININDEKAVSSFMSKLYKKELDMNKVYVFAPDGVITNDIDLFVDMNAMKGPMKLGKLPLLLMDSPHQSKKVANTSTQVAGGCMLVPGFKDVFKDIFKDNLYAALTRLVVTNPKVATFPCSNFDGYVDDTIRRLLPQAATEDKDLFEAVIKDLGKRYSRKISRISFTTDGSYNKGLNDLSSMLGVDFSILGKNEILICDDKLANEHKQRQALMIRHPKLSLKEFVMAKVVTRRNAIARLRNARTVKVLTQEQYLVLVSWVNNLKTGSIVLPSWDAELAAKMGGSDYDGDGFTMFFDERIIRLYKELNEGQIPFSSSSVASEKIKLSSDFLERAYLFSLQTGNISVGAAVMFAYRMRSILSDIKSGYLTQNILNAMREYHSDVLKTRMENLKKELTKTRQYSVDALNIKLIDSFQTEVCAFPFFTEEENNHGEKVLANGTVIFRDNFRHRVLDNNYFYYYFERSYVSDNFLYDTRKEKYVPIISEKLNNGEEINEDAVAEFEINAVSSDFWNVSNLEAILEDLDIAMASVVGRIIDSVKKGDPVSVPCLWLERFFSSNFYTTAILAANKQALEIKTKAGLDPESFVYYSQDEVFQLKKECVEYYNECINVFRKQLEASHKQASCLLQPQNDWEKALLHYGQHLARLNTLSNSTLKKDTEDNKDKVFSLQDTFKEYQVSFMRNLLLEANLQLSLAGKKVIDNARFIEILKMASEGKVNGKDFTSKFYRNFGSELLSYYDSKYNGEEPLVLREPLFARNGDVIIRDSICPENNVTELTFENGFSVDGRFFTKSKINGTYKVTVIEGKAYAISSIEELTRTAMAKSLTDNKVILKVRLREPKEVTLIEKEKGDKKSGAFSQEEIDAAQILKHYGINYVNHGAEVLSRLLDNTKGHLRICCSRFGVDDPNKKVKGPRLIQDFRLELEKEGQHIVVCDLNDEKDAQVLHKSLHGCKVVIDYIFPVASKNSAIYLFCTKE